MPYAMEFRVAVANGPPAVPLCCQNGATEPPAGAGQPTGRAAKVDSPVAATAPDPGPAA